MRSKLKSEELAAPLYVRPDDKMSIKHIDKEKAYKKNFHYTRPTSSIPEGTISAEMITNNIKVHKKNKARCLDGIRPVNFESSVDPISEQTAKISQSNPKR